MRKLRTLTCLILFGLFSSSIQAQTAEKAELNFEIKLDEEAQSMEIIWNSCLENTQLQIFNSKGRPIESLALCKENSVIDLSNYEKGGYRLLIDHYTGKGESYIYKDQKGKLAELNAKPQKKLSFRTSPNPAINYVDIQSDISLEGSSLQVIDLQGRVMINQLLSKGYDERVNISKLPQGMYLLRIEHASSVGVQRIIKQ